MKFFLSVLVVFIVHVGAVAQNNAVQNIGFNNQRLSYTGRIEISDTCTAFYWSGSYVSINVKNTKMVNALIADNRDNNFFYVIVDGDERKATKIIINKEKKLYTLATFNDKKKHHIKLYKITNTDDHITRIFGFEIDKAAKLLTPAKKLKRTIEFFGNSITCGHGVDVPVDSTDSGAPQYFNSYKTYGAITARHFNAQYHCTAKSGIGVTVSWFPQIMPEIYDRLNPNDSSSRWDFKKYTPDIVVVNLFQNDSWIVNQPNNEQFKARFGTVKPSEEFIIKAYANFVQSIRSKYPNAQIICCLGNMDGTKAGSKWPGYIEAAVTSLNDKKIVTHFFTYKNTPGHPKAQEQQAMANSLIAFITKNKYW